MTTIPQARRDALAATAMTFHDLNGLLTEIGQIVSDLDILREEGRTNAAKGADASLAACVRRLCATAASSRGEAEGKILVLEHFRQIYRGGSGPAHVLMAAMAEAAIAIETDQWLTGTRPR